MGTGRCKPKEKILISVFQLHCSQRA